MNCRRVFGEAAEKVFYHLPNLISFFQRRNFNFSLEIKVADVEALEPLILEKSGETEASFLEKTKRTIEVIAGEIERYRLGDRVRVESMIEFYQREGVSDYLGVKNQLKRAIEISGSRKINRTVQALLQERKSYDGEGVIEELVDYALFGSLINGRAIILSPDAMSAVPAYNFLRSGQDGQLMNPTIFLKNMRA